MTEVLRRELRKLFPGVKVEQAQLEELIRNDVLKRECREGKRANPGVEGASAPVS